MENVVYLELPMTKNQAKITLVNVPDNRGLQPDFLML